MLSSIRMLMSNSRPQYEIPMVVDGRVMGEVVLLCGLVFECIGPEQEGCDGRRQGHRGVGRMAIFS
jgi:hypothetical protein